MNNKCREKKTKKTQKKAATREAAAAMTAGTHNAAPELPGPGAGAGAPTSADATRAETRKMTKTRAIFLPSMKCDECSFFSLSQINALFMGV